LFCIQYAIALGCKTYVTSGSDDKINRAIQLGAAGGLNYKTDNWHKSLQELSGGFDVVIDSSGGDTFAKLVDICKPAGRIAMYGATLGAFNCGVPAKIFWKQLTICGSTMGNDTEFEHMLAYVNEKKIVPVVDSVFTLETFQQAADRMANGEQFGKVVVEIR
jgi:NADPH:quinone reductase-like Zn-dependent oxidoreductase